MVFFIWNQQKKTKFVYHNFKLPYNRHTIYYTLMMMMMNNSMLNVLYISHFPLEYFNEIPYANWTNRTQFSIELNLYNALNSCDDQLENR